MDPTTPPSTTSQLLPQSTPIKLGCSTTLPFTTTQKYRLESWTTMAEEMKKYIVGPMPVEQFLDDFFPTKDIPRYDTRKRFRPGCYDSTVKAASESESYEPFIATSKQYINNYDLKFVNSSSSPDCNQRSLLPFKIKPDISIYPPTTAGNVATDSALVEMFIEFKWYPSDDPFGDVRVSDSNGRSFLRDTKAAYDTLGQITSYAAAQLGAQFRTHVFSVLILRDTARLLRWDRSGAIVTEVIKYNEIDLLIEFLYRYSKAPAAMRGKDESASDPSPEEARAARDALGLKNTIPLVKLSIPDADGVRYYVTPSPEPTLYTPPGRATRGFKAYDILGKTLVFLKDSWRIDLPDIEAEGQVYKTLRDANVSHVPGCLASGDILSERYHATKTQAYVTEPWACHSDTRFIPHRHYRLSLDIIGRLLVDYKSSYEMVSAVRDALIAHQGAFKANVLHRDISPGNIIIDGHGKGWLIDWDLSKPVATSTETPRSATRTGTWQFMSANLMKQGVHTFLDDLESSLYVVLWVTLIYSEVSDRDQALTVLVNTLDPQIINNNPGYAKEDFLSGRSLLRYIQFPGRPALHNLLKNLATLFWYRYAPTPQNMSRFLKVEEVMKTLEDPMVIELIEDSHCKQYNDGTKKLNYTTVIEYFNDALEERSSWPVDDSPKRMVSKPGPSSLPIRKSGWRSTLFTK